MPWKRGHSKKTFEKGERKNFLKKTRDRVENYNLLGVTSKKKNKEQEKGSVNTGGIVFCLRDQ